MPEKFEFTGDKYAVAVRSDNGLMIVESYKTRKRLESGYKAWSQLSSKRKVFLKPVPIEILDKDGTCKVLEDLIGEADVI